MQVKLRSCLLVESENVDNLGTLIGVLRGVGG